MLQHSSLSHHVLCHHSYKPGSLACKLIDFLFSGSKTKKWCVLLPDHGSKGNYSLGNARPWKYICSQSKHCYFLWHVNNIIAHGIMWSVTYTLCLQAENNMEYVIEAHDTDDMRSWLATIKYCMRTMHPTQDGRWVATDVILSDQQCDIYKTEKL